VTWARFGASALLPGTGQLMDGRSRGWIGVGVDAGLWVLFADARSTATADRRAYRDLAWETARGAPRPRVEGDFDYFERLVRWTRSGAFDRDPGAAGLQPEVDPATFNGDAWRLARQLFWSGGEVPPSPEAEAAALDFYRRRAYGEELAWDWSDVPAARQEYARLIRSSDDAFGRARLVVGGLIVNRLVSVVDVWLSERTPGTTRAAIGPMRLGPGWTPALMVTWNAGGRK
jgi:hypothetical protein